MMLFLYLLCRYANRAKNIKNKAKINEDPKDALLREFQKEIEKLRAQLAEGALNIIPCFCRPPHTNCIDKGKKEVLFA